MDRLIKQVKSCEISIEAAILEALPLLREKVPDETIHWLVNELQGYDNSMDFYNGKNSSELPEYRVVSGTLKLLDQAGNLTNFVHPFAKRGKYFIGAPASWLEQFADLQGENTLVDCRDLASYLSTGQGTVVCQCSKSQLTHALAEIRKRLVETLVESCEASASTLNPS